MADISDVEQALADAATAVLYPEGSSQSSIAGATCRIYRGWPNSATLNADLNAGVVNVTISSDNDSGKITTRYHKEWLFKGIIPSLTVGVVGKTILIDGTASVGNIIGALVDGAAYAYRIVAGDTTSLVAANLCAAIQTRQIATVDGTSINVPGSSSMQARVVADNMAAYEGRRQEKDVRIIFWCPTPTMRDSISAAVDLALSTNAFLVLSDNSQARIVYRNSATYDQSQNALLYRRDLVYSLEYATIISADLPSMLFGAAAINGRITFG